MKKMNKLSYILLVLSFFITSNSLAFEKTSKPLDPFEIGRYNYCGSDSDCIVVINGCCPCDQGGERVAINKGHLDRFKNRFDCKRVDCPDRSLEECEDAVVSCLSNRCRIFFN